MGSLCRASPQTTNTNTNTNNNTSYNNTTTANAAGDMRTLYDRLFQVAGTPYNPYAGPLVAGLTSEQQAGIEQVNGMSNAAQPFYQEAAGLARQGAAPISSDDISRHMNPFINNVVDPTKALFNSQNATQQSTLRGNAALKGALGGDRAGIAGAELARNQKLAQDPVLANLYSQGYGQALGAAQADRAAAGQGAFSLGSIGSATQNSGIQGGQAAIGAGTVRQQNNQQQIGADYQRYLNDQAFPYQQTQWLTQYGLPVLQGQGQTSTGTSNTQGTTNQTQVTTPPQASPFSQALGVGLTAAGLFSGNPFMSLSGAGSMFGSGSNPTGWNTNPWSNAGQAQMNQYGYGYAHGGPVRNFRRAAEGGRIPLPRPRPLLNDAYLRYDPFLQFPSNYGERTGLRDLSELTNTFGAKTWRAPEPRRGGMVNNFNELLDRRFYDDNALKWKELMEAGVSPMPLGATGRANKEAPVINKYGDTHPLTPLMGFAEGGRVEGAGNFLDAVRGFRKALREHYDEGGVVGGSPYRNRIANIESRGSGDYSALGPMLRGGRQALGRYGIMAENLPSWSRDALGREISREEFMKSPQLQDAIFDHRFGRYVNKYGPEGAAKAWFAGEKGMNNPNARDALGTSVADYARKFSGGPNQPMDRAGMASLAVRAAAEPMGQARDPEVLGMDDGGMGASRRAIALGLSLIGGGGGSGFASGGEVFGKADRLTSGNPAFEDRFSSVPGFEPLVAPQARINEGFEAARMDNPMKGPSWSLTAEKMDDGRNPFTMIPPDDDAEVQQVADGEQAAIEEAATHDEMSAQSANGRADPFQTYQQNRQQGSQGDDVRSALMAAGLGMLAGKSSNALTNIGEGGLKGLAQYNINKKERQNAELAARRLMQQAEQFNQRLDLSERQFKRGLDVDAQRERLANQRLTSQEERADARLQQQIAAQERGEAARVRREEAALKLQGAKAASKEEELEMKNDLKRIEAIRKDAEGSQTNIDAAERGLAALPKAYTGAWAYDPRSMVDAPTQTLKGAINQLTLESGQKMKGSFSDKDIEFLKAMLGGKLATNDTIQRSLQGIQASATREKLRSEFYQDYRDLNKSLRGADEAWNRYIDKNKIIVRNGDDDVGFKINEQAARADYSNFLKARPSWVPKTAKDWNPDSKEYIDADGKVRKAE